jgi:predicted secreted protein
MKLSSPLLFVMLLLGVCVSMSSAKVVIEGDQLQNNDTLHLASGHDLKIRLSGNPSTGASWTVQKIDDKAILSEPSEPVYEARETGGRVVGPGGTFTISLRGSTPGMTSVHLVYKRPWNNEVFKEVELNVVVV